MATVRATDLPVRPISSPTMCERLVIAWRVFTGRYDAVDWNLAKPAYSIYADDELNAEFKFVGTRTSRTLPR